VIVVGIDGAGSFIKQADTPNFDRIFESGDFPAYKDILHLTGAKPRISTEQHKSKFVIKGENHE